MEFINKIFNIRKSNKNIGRIFNDKLFRWERIRVVLMGSKGTGKTVFLTSVGDQLKHHNPKSFNLNGWKAVFDSDLDQKVQESALKGGRLFEYARAREYLAKGEWPAKTKDWSVLTIPFTLVKNVNGKEKRRQIILEMLDLPGERVADFAMIGRSYSEWCGWMETRFGGISGASGFFKQYLVALQNLSSVERDKAIALYKEFLVDEYCNYTLSLTPSIVKLGIDGKTQSKGSREEFRKDLEHTPIGLAEDLQFIPLAKENFSQSSPHFAWIKDFEKAYNKYVETIIAPIASWCSHANSLIYFVDILDLLNRGAQVYNSEKKFAEQALAFFKHRKPDLPFPGIIDYLMGLFVTRIDSIIVVPTKADRVCDQGDRMVKLAHSMLESVVRTMGLEEKKTAFISCAAVDTSEIYKEEMAIRARIKTADGNIELKQFKVRDVPEDWPESANWQIGAYNWPNTFPMFDEREDLPPKQRGLDAIMQRVLEINA